MPARQPLLRRQLLGWLLAPLCVLLIADAFVSYWVAASFAQLAYDRSLVETARELSLHVRSGNGGLALDLSEDARDVLLTDPVDRIWFALLTGEGRLLSGEPIPGGQGMFYDALIGDAPVRVVELAAQGALVRVAETRMKRNELAREILLSVVGPQVLLIVLACALVWIGVARGLRPLDRLRAALAARSHRDRSPVSAEGVPGEVMPIVLSINGLLARLDKALTLQSRFIADASHQLKTPLAALRTELDLALREEDPGRMRESLRSAHAGLERLSRLVSQLLSLARNEPEAASAVRLAPLDLDALVLEVTKEWVPAALRREVDLGFEGSGRPVTVLGDPVRLREMLDNLVDNAVRYSHPGGRITVRVTPERVVEVSDDGPSIPPAERARVFERFHRLLGTPHDGSGLGLAIAREVARIHGAEITLRDNADGVGNTFAVAFPAP